MLLSLERRFGRERCQEPPRNPIYILRALLTFGLVLIGWVFFRAANLTDSLYVLRQMFTPGHFPSSVFIPAWLGWLVFASVLIALLEEKLEWIDRLSRGPAWAYVMAVVVLLFCGELVGVTEKAGPFLYFQF